MEKGRIVFADWLRVLACFLVMLVHASENFYGADNSGLAGNVSMLANEANRFWVAFYDGFCGRSCVPVFIMLSAFLLVPLKPGMGMGEFYRKRFLRIVPPVLIFMLLYSLLPLLWGAMNWEQSRRDLLFIPWNFPSMAGHLWFIYPLISLYIIIPIVSPWLEKTSAKDEIIFLIFFGASTFIPFIHRFVSREIWGECFWNGFHALWYCSGYLGYLVMAHFIRVHLDWSGARRMRVGALCFLAGAAFTGWAFWFKGSPGVLIETPMLEWAWEFCTPNVALATFGIFTFFSGIRATEDPKIISSLSKLSFAMYLMHLFFLAPIANLLIGEGGAAAPLVPVWAAIPSIAVLTFICCAVTAKILSFIPGCRYFAGIQ